MKRYFLRFSAVILFAFVSPCLADRVVHVSLEATYTATQPCTDNCTESFNISFLFDPTILPPNQWDNSTSKPVGIIPGSMEVTSSGFMGEFRWIGNPQCCEGYIPFVNTSDAYYDEFDILDFSSDGTLFKPGVYSTSDPNGVGTQIFICRTAGCLGAFGSGSLVNIQPTGSFVITRVPEPGFWLLMSIGCAMTWIRTGQCLIMISRIPKMNDFGNGGGGAFGKHN